jgi:hypothetical protein
MTLAKFGLALFVGWFLVVAALGITWGISAASCESEDCTGVWLLGAVGFLLVGWYGALIMLPIGAVSVFYLMRSRRKAQS